MALACLLSCACAAHAQDADTRKVLQEHRDGLQSGADRVLEGSRRIEQADALDVAAIAEGAAGVAEGFCQMVTSNAGAFEALGVDFSGLVRRGNSAEDAARYEQAEALCAEVQPKAQTFALQGCTDVVVGGRTTLAASLSTGTYRFTANKGGIVDIVTNGNRATLDGIAPGIVTVKAERNPGNGSSTASEVVHSLEVASINDGNPAIIGIYDAKGRRIDTRVPVDVRPREAARRVGYRPADPLLIASGDGSEVMLRPFATGTTLLQATTACGDTTGAPLEVEIRPCTDEVRDQLRQEQARLLKRRDNVLAAVADVLNDPEFERALREFEGHAKDLATKTAELVISAAAPGMARAGKATKNLPTTAEHAKRAQGTLEEIAEYANWAGHAVSIKTAGDDAAGRLQRAETTLKMMGDLATAMLDNPVVGAFKTALEAGLLAEDVGQDIGSTLGAVERLKELDEQLDAIIRELEDVWRRMELCKDRRPKDAPSPGAEPAGKSPTKSRSPAPEGAPPEEVEFIDVDIDGDAPDKGEEPAVEQPVDSDESSDEPSADPPGSPAAAAALAALAQEKQCPGWEPVATRQSGILSAIGDNMVSLHGRFGNRNVELFEPLARHLEKTDEAIGLVLAAEGLREAEQDDALRRAGALLDEYPAAALLDYEKQLRALAVQAEACSGLLRNSFEVKIEELRTRY